MTTVFQVSRNYKTNPVSSTKVTFSGTKVEGGVGLENHHTRNTNKKTKQKKKVIYDEGMTTKKGIVQSVLWVNNVVQLILTLYHFLLLQRVSILGICYRNQNPGIKHECVITLFLLGS